MRKCFFSLLTVLYFSIFSLYSSLPVLYLTYTEDPSSSITVQWHTEDLSMKEGIVRYRKEGEVPWQAKIGSCSRLEKGGACLFFRADLSGLDPSSHYEFQIEGDEEILRFKTLPSELNCKIKFIIGGDVYKYFNKYRRMNLEVAKHDPDFVILGGDIAYTHQSKALFKGKNWEMQRWNKFFTEWKKTMVTSDGRMVPLVAVVGNHDVPKGLVRPDNQEVLFYKLFAMKEKNLSYRALDIGGYLSFFLLDTNHTYPIEGAQTGWLENALQVRQSTPYKLAVYHVGAFPSVYKYSSLLPSLIRKNWCPLFEKYGLQMAFEHHSHAFKVTHPIKEEKIDPAGVVYVGDGCWGVKPRITVSGAWYLEKKSRRSCYNVISLDKEGMEVVCYDVKGNILASLKKTAGEG